MIFSERYAPAIRNGKLTVELPMGVREKIADAMASHNHMVSVQRNPDDRWIDHSDVISELLYDMGEHYNSIKFPVDIPESTDTRLPLFELARRGLGENVLDTIEMMVSGLFEDRRNSFEATVNVVFEDEGSSWRLVRGQCIRLDQEFIGSGNARIALERLAAGPFAGAEAEYGKALREQASGESKDAIADACKSFESTLKILTGLEHANADALTKALVEQGYLNDIPENIRDGFRQTVLMSLPFIRNKLAGHGQGAEVVEVPARYSALALQLAAALQNFLISKYLEHRPPVPETPLGEGWDDELPF